MAEWEEKLGAILNNPQAMSQIMSIAQSLGGDRSGGKPPAAEEETPPPAGETPPEEQAQSLGALGEADAGQPGELPQLDPRLMEMGMRALAAYQDPNNARAALLQALRPFVKPQRYAKVDKAVQIARLSKAIRAALQGFQGAADP